jgi:hypothetical protein
MYINNNSPEFEITPLNFPITLQQNDTAKIEVCAPVLPQSGNNPKDAVIFKTNCNEYFLFDLELQPDLPYLRTGDVNFYQTYINYEVSKWFYVDNVGFGEAEIYGITWKDSLHFTHTDLSATLNNPLIIAAGESYRFNVYYKADEGQVVSTDTAFLLTNATKSKLFSVWTGTGPLTVNLISPTNLSQKNPINALLSWTDMGKNYTYHLIIATDQYFNNIVKDTNTDKTIYPSHLSANTKYYWKVQPVHNGNPQAFVTYWIFETDTSISGVENNFNENANDIEIFPNPANSFLTINYCLDKPAAVNMKITNLFGEDLIILKDGNQVEAGKYSANIKIDNLRDGMYFLVCKIGSRVQGIKFVKAD